MAKRMAVDDDGERRVEAGTRQSGRAGGILQAVLERTMDVPHHGMRERARSDVEREALGLCQHEPAYKEQEGDRLTRGSVSTQEG